MKTFTKILLRWYDENKRELPWKNTKDAYKIWLSEIILQQTRVEQGLPYYKKFIKKFPSIHALAKATEDEVLKLWEGLGYYSRARNLHYTAKYIVEHHKGNFPDKYEDIIKLKGIGPYTTAAILSFAFQKPYPAVDGNVLRVISRITGNFLPIEDKKTHKWIYEWLLKNIDSKRPGDFNQALMDFGSTICTPKKYKCDLCPLSEICLAFKKDLVDKLPISNKKVSKKDRYFHYFILRDKYNNTLLNRRKKDIWTGLYDYPYLETRTASVLKNKDVNQSLKSLQIEAKKSKIREIIELKKHVLTHQNIHIMCYLIDCEHLIQNEFHLVSLKKISKFAFPIVLKEFNNEFLKDKT